MNCTCNIILDLLPLYHDGVCSDESADAVKEHLGQCKECAAYYKRLQESDNLTNATSDADGALNAVSLKAVKRKIAQKKIIACVLSVLMVVVIAACVSAYMKNTSVVIPYDDNITVIERNGDLIAHLARSNYTRAYSVSVEVEKDGTSEVNLYFYFQTTLWDDMLLGGGNFGIEYVLAYAEKGAANINNIYYFTGEYSGIGNMNEGELAALEDEAVLIWSK